MAAYRLRAADITAKVSLACSAVYLLVYISTIVFQQTIIKAFSPSIEADFIIPYVHVFFTAVVVIISAVAALKLIRGVKPENSSIMLALSVISLALNLFGSYPVNVVTSRMMAYMGAEKLVAYSSISTSFSIITPLLICAEVLCVVSASLYEFYCYEHKEDIGNAQ